MGRFATTRLVQSLLQTSTLSLQLSRLRTGRWKWVSSQRQAEESFRECPSRKRDPAEATTRFGAEIKNRSELSELVGTGRFFPPLGESSMLIIHLGVETAVSQRTGPIMGIPAG